MQTKVIGFVHTAVIVLLPYLGSLIAHNYAWEGLTVGFILSWIYAHLMLVAPLIAARKASNY